MRKCDENRPYIFISYSHRDSKKVIEIIEKMSEQGYNIWYDEGIDPGTEWDENIAKHVKDCAYFIAFVSSGYVGSKNCKDELNYSRDLDKNQFIVYLEDVQLPDGMAMRMNRIQSVFWYKYNFTNIDDAYEKLYSAEGIDNTKLYVANDSQENAKESSELLKNETKIKNTVNVLSDNTSKKKYFIIGGVAVAIILIVVFIIIRVNNKCLFEGHVWTEATCEAPKTCSVCGAEEGEALAHTWTEATCEAPKTCSVCGAVEGKAIGHAWIDATIDTPKTCSVCSKTEGGVSFDAYTDEALWDLIFNNEDYKIGSEKGFDLVMELCNRGDARGAREVGYYYKNGNGNVLKDYEKAKEYFELGIERGDTASCTGLGLMYENGLGVDVDYDKAFELYQKRVSSNPNDYVIYRYIGDLYKNGHEIEGLTLEYATECYLNYLTKGTNEWWKETVKASLKEILDDILCGPLIDIYKYLESDDLKILMTEIVSELADNDNVEACAFVGAAYKMHDYPGGKDLDKAKYYLEKGISKGLWTCAFYLGQMYEYDKDVQDYKKAYDYYKMESDLGNRAGLRNIGRMYSEGKKAKGITKEYAIECLNDYIAIFTNEDDVNVKKAKEYLEIVENM